MSALPTVTEAPAPRAGAKVRTFRPACRECGERFETPSDDARFCSPAHRADFNNRRRLRGAEIYDLFMCQRYDREVGARLKVWASMCKLAAHWREEDRRQRAGRKTWRPPSEAVEDKGFIFAQVLVRAHRTPRKGA